MDARYTQEMSDLLRDNRQYMTSSLGSPGGNGRREVMDVKGMKLYLLKLYLNTFTNLTLFII
jgi:hypothetical protein